MGNLTAVMGWFKKRAESQEQIDELQARIAVMAERLEQADAGKRDLDLRVGGIVTRLEEADAEAERARTAQEEAAAGADAFAPPEGPPEFDSLHARIDEMAQRLDEVDRRITSISTELANQISELSGDLESLGANEPPTGEIVDELRDAQSRLANEQARYQIAFRQDLADLADRLRRG